mgnify:CR=1 FL=1
MGNANQTSAPYPVVKWAGGKRQLQDRIIPVLREKTDFEVNRYFEPFFGGGAILFALQPKFGAFSDINQGLLNLYIQIRDNLDAFHEVSKALQDEYNKLDLQSQASKYYEIRTYFNEVERDGLVQAANFLFLNKAGFNGMYRENAKGGFNIPFGKRRTLNLFEYSNLVCVSQQLKNTDMYLQDYRLTVASDKVKPGDLVYFDPPYAPLSATSSFTGYTADGFSGEDQETLANLVRRLTDEGVYVAVSNSSAPHIEKIYRGFQFRELAATRAISASAAGRKSVTEFLITNYELI